MADQKNEFNSPQPIKSKKRLQARNDVLP